MRKRAVVLVGCAWVVWSQTMFVGTLGSDWTALGAFETSAACNDAAGRYLAERRQEGHTVEGTMVTIRKDKVIARLYLRCLPDTIDPRDKK